MCMAQGAAEIDPGDVDRNLSKARALGNALLCCMAVPWALCVIIYTGVPLCILRKQGTPLPCLPD